MTGLLPFEDVKRLFSGFFVRAGPQVFLISLFGVLEKFELDFSFYFFNFR